MARAVVQTEDIPESVTLSSFKGLKNTVTQERLAPDELERATNIDIDDVGQIHRRRGYDRKDSADWHSLFTGSTRTFGVRNGSLVIIYPNYTHAVLLPNVGADPVAYVDVGSTTYFASRSVSGKINPDGSVAPWGQQTGAGQWVSPIVNPTTTIGAVAGKLVGPPPFATSLTYFNGRIYLANERTLWATELYLYDLVDRTKNFKFFEDDITGTVAVTDGVYVGTKAGVYFLSGLFADMRRVKMSSDAVLPGSMIEVPADFIGLERTQSKTAAMMMTTGGMCAGLDGGLYYNLTQDKFWFPDATRVSALFREQDGVNQYIGVADNAGTPASNARIGDYVEAEIIRFQGA